MKKTKGGVVIYQAKNGAANRHTMAEDDLDLIDVFAETWRSLAAYDKETPDIASRSENIIDI